jgi:hypothetical protein
MQVSIVAPDADGLVRLTMAAGALLSAPIWEKHHRGTNYLAIIDIDPRMPGGLARQFVHRGKGECLYVVEQIAVLDAVEFAADYTTGVGRRDRLRWYGVVAEKTASQMSLIPYPSGAKAVVAANELRQARDATAPRLRVPTPMPEDPK